ncbi:MAG TPA: hypothetical protein VIE19_05485 [Lapillicoccus sp.]
MSETTLRARGAGIRTLSVVVGPRRFDVVVDEHLLVGEVLALVEPGRELMALTMSGESVPLDETVALAHLETGTMLLTAPVDVDVPVPRLRRSAPDAVPAAGVGGTAGSRSPGPVRTSSPGGSSSRRRLGYATTTSAVEAEALLPVGSTTGHLRRAGASGGRGSVASRRSRRRRAGTPAAAVRPLALVLVASLFGGLAVAASFLAPRATSVWPQVVAIVMVAVGMLLAQSTTAPRLLRLTAPVLGLVGGAVATGVLSEGAVVALVGACAGAALVALTGRSGAGPDRYVPRVWLIFAGGLGGLALLVLVMGLTLASVAAIGLAVVVLAARVVPDLVLDVDDDVLLDISRLSVTSWSPREARRPRRRGWRIDDEAVGDVVVAASVEQLATLVGLTVVSAGCSAVLLGVLVTQTAVSALSVQLLLLAAAVALTLTARAYRRRSDRTLLRLAALAPALSVGLPVAASLEETWGVVASAAAVVAALALVGVALALGRGFRSLWASRLADLLELLALLAVLPLALWAAGIVERAMALFA